MKITVTQRLEEGESAIERSATVSIREDASIETMSQKIIQILEKVGWAESKKK